MRAEFPSTDVRAHMSIFDCKRTVPLMSRPAGDPGKKKVLEHVRFLATAYGLDEDGVRQAVLEYRDVAGTVLGLIRRGKPLAAASNACVWSFVVGLGLFAKAEWPRCGSCRSWLGGISPSKMVNARSSGTLLSCGTCRTLPEQTTWGSLPTPWLGDPGPLRRGAKWRTQPLAGLQTRQGRGQGIGGRATAPV